VEAVGQVDTALEDHVDVIKRYQKEQKLPAVAVKLLKQYI
jgi:hypothetical protein